MRWTAISTKQPRYNEVVLLLYKDGSVMAGMRTLGGYVSKHNAYRFPDVTHWMRMPQLPIGTDTP